MELIEKLGIDWKLLIAQIVNFSILLFLLAKFVYRPVVQMMEKRAKTIEKGVADARASGEKLARIEKLHDERMAQAEREIGTMFEKARADAEGLKKEIIGVAHAQSQDLLKRAELQLKEEKKAMMEELRSEVVSIVISATGRILEREFSSADQKRLMDALSREIKTL